MITNELPRCIEIIAKQRQFFQTGKTKDLAFRIAQLQILKQLVMENKSAIIQALKSDLHKPEFETYATEIGVNKEIDYALKHINNWTKPKKTAVPWDLFSYSAKIYPEPFGVILIIGPWNYPFQLIISPLVGAIASGNCTIIKPSEFAPHTSNLIS